MSIFSEGGFSERHVWGTSQGATKQGSERATKQASERATNQGSERATNQGRPSMARIGVLLVVIVEVTQNFDPDVLKSQVGAE